MIPFGFHAPLLAWLLALIAPLVAVYFLKLKRPRQEVPSLVLWARVLDDRRVNSPFQRFKRHLLLLLQILLLCLIALAAMQPYWHGGAPGDARRLPVLVDVSASMAARAEPGGPTRLEVARERVRELIDGLGPDAELALIAFGDRAWRLADFTDNRRVLHDAVDALAVEDVPGHAGDALRLAQAMGQAVPIDEVLLLSDGNLPSRTDTELAYRLDYRLIEPGGANLGITACEARQRADGRWEVLVAVSADVAHGGSGSVRITRGDEPLATELVAVEAGDTRRLLLSLSSGAAGLIEVAVERDGFDALPADDRAWLELPRARPLRVLVEEGLDPWRLAATALPSTELVDAAGRPDLAIAAGASAAALGAAVHVGTGAPPGAIADLVEVVEEPGTVVDWVRTAPPLRHVDLTDLVLLDDVRWRGPAGVFDLENRGWRVLVHGANGPLAVERREDGRVAYHLLFDVRRSTLPYRVGFPVLVANLVQEARRLAGLAEVGGRRTGVLAVRDLPPGAPVVVRGPGGGEQALTSDDAGAVHGIAAPRAGVYEVVAGDQRRPVAAALLDRGETALAVSGELAFREVAVGAVEQARATDRQLWRVLALCGLAVLLAEWWLFQRRPGGW